jgi:hypothetical protein|eukprot:CAMPEP_0174301980 /NCGR_PEP_ID=MMETSP0809-20121228/59369_1 /TAXON_ID=73025 ORGANISM="Eutreptiella gymnastica-like, Strain CCMP1594" /NCGR_SAMPLE_ID=MMETSP0809 /ASSEMBLY_ACC=CAM_ASM_000658 /LENGTH=183 /DNA_ID=CAMNT_0015407831 /DNA_START=1956 /DNA_END=2507 /DNA_ORIENTATION=+
MHLKVCYKGRAAAIKKGAHCGSCTALAGCARGYYLKAYLQTQTCAPDIHNGKKSRMHPRHPPRVQGILSLDGTLEAQAHSFDTHGTAMLKDGVLQEPPAWTRAEGMGAEERRTNLLGPACALHLFVRRDIPTQTHPYKSLEHIPNRNRAWERGVRMQVRDGTGSGTPPPCLLLPSARRAEDAA